MTSRTSGKSKARSLIVSDLEWARIRENAGRAGMNVSRYVMACTLDRAPPPDSQEAAAPEPASPYTEDLFDRDHPLALDEGEQRHLYELVKYIAAALHALLGPVGNTPLTLPQMVRILVLAKQAELHEQGKALPPPALWRRK